MAEVRANAKKAGGPWPHHQRCAHPLLQPRGQTLAFPSASASASRLRNRRSRLRARPRARQPGQSHCRAVAAVPRRHPPRPGGRGGSRGGGGSAGGGGLRASGAQGRGLARRGRVPSASAPPACSCGRHLGPFPALGGGERERSRPCLWLKLRSPVAGSARCCCGARSPWGSGSRCCCRCRWPQIFGKPPTTSSQAPTLCHAVRAGGAAVLVPLMVQRWPPPA